jgi:predicted ABC-type ATPase
MRPEQPVVVVLGGINGAGKSTSARALLADQLAVTSFVNADEIARGLCALAPETVAFEAGRTMLHRLHELAEQRADFGFETTLAGRTYLSFLEGLRGVGYTVEMYYFWLRSADIAIQRVAARVRAGGHDIPEATIRQRYGRSPNNFWSAYRHLADAWYVYDNSATCVFLLAAGTHGEAPLVGDKPGWRTFLSAVGHAKERHG